MCPTTSSSTSLVAVQTDDHDNLFIVLNVVDREAVGTVDFVVHCWDQHFWIGFCVESGEQAT